MSRTIINKGWEFLPVKVLGEDLVVDFARATWFGDGGLDDPQDRGNLACGYKTRGHPELLGCSLPMLYVGRDIRTQRIMRGCPIPLLPYGLNSKGQPRPGGTQVIVTCGAETLTIPLIDIGPDPATHHGIDLTQAAFKALGGNLKKGVLSVSFRVLGGAKFLK